MATLRVQKLDIARNDRCAFIGATGSGKTTLAKAILWGLPHVAVLDPKRTFRLPAEWPHVVTEKRKVVEDWEGPATIIYRPNADELSDGGERLQWWFYWLFERGNTIGYVDEVRSVVNRTRPGHWHMVCMTQGRERGVGLWQATQRPRNVPIEVFSESDHIFCFRLRHPEDRARVAEFTDPALLAVNPADHAFWYYSDPKQKLTYFESAKIGKVLS